MKLKEDGYTPGFPQIVLNNKIFGESYDKTIKFFLDNGYELDETLFTFPYDWRLDISHTKELLDNLVNTIKIQTGSEKVDFVAHSMGGLVARNYISDAIKAPNVRKLFTLGTPYLGAVNSLKILMYGECLTSWHLELSPICFGIKNSETKDIAQNMISMYEITPSKKYFDFYTGKDRYQPLPYKINDEVLNYNQIKNLLTSNGLNTSLFSPSETFHSLDENLSDTNGVDITIVAGSGYPTLGQIIEKKKIHLSGTTDNRKDIKIINGDKTVPLFSASLNDPSESRSISGNARVFYTNQSHGNLVTNSSALKLVKNIVEDNSQLPDGVSANAYSLPAVWWLLGVFSPVDIHAYDFLGNHTGLTTNGDFEANIPGSSYDTMDDAKFIFLPNDGIYNLRFEATGQGSFDFKIRKYEDDTIFQETLYKDIPLTASTKAETQFNTSSTESPIIHLDKDGNGTVDQDINSSSNLTGNEIFDQIPPQTNIQISGALGNNNWYRSDVLVTLIAEDEENGSGILKTEYSLDNGQTVNIYSQPFTISEEKINKLKFRSVDNAGNEEDPRETEIKIDKTAPQVAIDANPKILWPANSKMVDVIIAGSSFDTNPLSIRIAVDDEYNKIEPYITNFNQTIKLQAGRRGDDLDGRKYTLKAIGEDLAGNIEQASVEIVVPHDQGKSNRNFYLQLFETFSKLFR